MSHDENTWSLDLAKGFGGKKLKKKRNVGMFRGGYGGGWGGGFGGQPCCSQTGKGSSSISQRRWDKLPDLERVQANPKLEHALWKPRADIYLEDPEHLRVDIEIPEIPKEDISLTIKDNVLTIAALKPPKTEEEHGVCYQAERNFGKFFRRMQLPIAVDPRSARTQLEKGVLRVWFNVKHGIPVSGPSPANHA